MVCGWASNFIRFQLQKRESLNLKNRWWNELRFGPFKRNKIDLDDEDTLSESDELLVAHADDFELPKLKDDEVEQEIQVLNTTERPDTLE